MNKTALSETVTAVNGQATWMRFELGISLISGFLDLIEIEPIGLVRLFGWSKNLLVEASNIKLFIGSCEISRLNVFFVQREDLLETDRFAGFSLEYYLPRNRLFGPLKLVVDGKQIWQTDLTMDWIAPAYENLLSGPQVLDRNSIYGYGPPNLEIDPTIVALLSTATGRVLDFGCGSGPIVKHLCDQNIDAYGIEIDRPAIRESIDDKVRARITLYPGEFPMPFTDKSFDLVIATEVIEHIPDFRLALRDIVRICRGTFIITVPDMSAIPLCFPNGVVPWHLLESTHVNFFNQTSLTVELAPYFSCIEFGRLHPREINGSKFYTSLVARCCN